MLLLMLMLMNAPATPAEQLWEKIRGEPNVVLLMRNADADAATEPGEALQRDESGKCEGEAQLSEAGKDHARYIGVRFAARGIEPVVVSSPACRCLETAMLAFGGGAATDPLLRRLPTPDDPQSSDLARKTRSFIATQQGKQGKVPLVLISHAANIALLTHESVTALEAVVGLANAAGDVQVLGKVSLTD